MQKIFFIIMGLQVVFGVGLTITIKFMNKQRVEGLQFQHAYLQSILSFMGQMFNFAIYFYQKRSETKEKKNSNSSNEVELDNMETSAQTKKFLAQENENKNKTMDKIPFLKLLVPSAFHALCSMTGYAAYFHIQASISMMLQGSLPIITALFSLFLFKISILKHQKLGMGVILLGSFVLGVLALQQEEPIPNANAPLGIFLSFLSLLFFGLLIVAEELLLKNENVPGTLLAGMEGMFAFVISIISIPILNSIWGDFIDVSLFFEQLSSSGALCCAAFCIIFCDMFYSLFAILCTKHSNSLTRSIVFQLRCIGVWMVAICLENPQYLQDEGSYKNWEKFNVAQMFGYLLLALGVFIFQEFIVVGYCNFDQDIKKPEIKGDKYQQMQGNSSENPEEIQI